MGLSICALELELIMIQADAKNVVSEINPRALSLSPLSCLSFGFHIACDCHPLGSIRGDCEQIVSVLNVIR